MNNKGITMVTVVVMIIVMIILATVSFVAGNKMLVSSSEYKEKQEIETVRAAVLRKKSEMNMSGTLTPIGESYVGVKDPILQSDGADTIVATDWYYLDQESLEKLGVYDVNTGFIVNYDYEVILSLKNAEYLEEYMVVEAMYKYIENEIVAGTALENKSASNATAKMVKDNENGDLYGTGWYLLKKTENGVAGDFGTEYEKYINHDYLINFNTREYVKVDENFEEI